MLRQLFERVTRWLLNSDRDRALSCLLAAAVRLHPRDAFLRLQLGAALAPIDRSRAERELLAGAAMASLDARLTVYGANQLLFLGALDAARQLVEHAAAMQCDDDLVANELVFLRGMLALSEDDIDLGERLLWQAVHLDPTDASYLSCLLTCLVRLGRRDEARAIADARVGMLSRPDLVTDRIRTLGL